MSEAAAYYIAVETRLYVEPEQPAALGEHVTIAGKRGSPCGADGLGCHPRIVSGRAFQIAPRTL